MSLDLNRMVKVKLTEHGKKVLRNHGGLRVEDPEGYTTWQLRDLVVEFKDIRCGESLPFTDMEELLGESTSKVATMNISDAKVRFEKCVEKAANIIVADIMTQLKFTKSDEASVAVKSHIIRDRAAQKLKDKGFIGNDYQDVNGLNRVGTARVSQDQDARFKVMLDEAFTAIHDAQDKGDHQVSIFFTSCEMNYSNIPKMKKHLEDLGYRVWGTENEESGTINYKRAGGLCVNGWWG